MSFIDQEFPQILGAELFRPKPNYITKFVIQPRVVHEFLKGPGDTVQLDRYHYWADDDASGLYDSSLTKEARSRSSVQTIGVGASRDLNKDKIILHLTEFTGPSDPTNPASPGTFQIPLQRLLSAQRKLWELGQRAFHDSIGSSNLLDDYLRWEDRVYVGELLKTSYTANPSEVADGGSYDLSDHDSKPPRWTIEDSDLVVTRMTQRNALKFDDGNYWCLCTPEFMRHLQRDPEFREVARYPNSMMVSQMIPGAGDMSPPQINPAASQYTQGLMAGQSDNYNGMQTMPAGLVYRGVRYFVSNNLPSASVTLTYTNNGSYAAGPAARNAELGIFFGPQAVGVGVGGAGPQIRLNNNDDFQRMVIAIWSIYGDFKLIEERFVTVGRSFTS